MNEDRMPMMHPGEEMPMGGPGPMPSLRHIADLGLDAKQEEAVEAIETRALKDSIRKKAEIELADLELMVNLDKDTVDLGVVEGKMKKVEALKTEMRMIHVKALEEVKTTLTPEQRKKLKEAFAKGPHRERHMARAEKKTAGSREKEDDKSE
jgi:Spy/CpxP family protein refolding chaperone